MSRRITGNGSIFTCDGEPFANSTLCGGNGTVSHRRRRSVESTANYTEGSITIVDYGVVSSTSSPSSNDTTTIIWATIVGVVGLALVIALIFFIVKRNGGSGGAGGLGALISNDAY